jgi:Sulfotransferase domain
LLPDFIIVGAQKCGTTSLYRYLVEHPQIVPAFRKELHFFDNNAGKGNTLRYRAYFPTSLYKRRFERTRGSDLITGEATPYYFYYPLTPERVRDVVPRARLIVLLRDPVDRAYSHYHHEVRLGNEKLSFEEAIERESERLDGERERILRGGNYDSFSHRKHSYLSRGIYVDQLQNWRRSFPEEQLLVLKSEDLFADPAAIVGRTLNFLGLSSLEREEYSKDNKGSYPGIDPATRRWLVDYFRPYNDRLYDFLGRDFGWKR